MGDRLASDLGRGAAVGRPAEAHAGAPRIGRVTSAATSAVTLVLRVIVMVRDAGIAHHQHVVAGPPDDVVLVAVARDVRPGGRATLPG